MKARLYGTRVFVRDFDSALKFYQETLGLDVLFCGAEMGWAEFDTGDAHLCIQRVDGDDPEPAADLVGRFVGVSLQVDDIAATYEELRGAGVPFEQPPETQPWGGVLAHFRDPEGNILTLLGSPAAA